MSEQFQMIMVERLLFFISAFFVKLDDSTLTASNASGPEIVPGVNAFLSLTDIDMQYTGDSVSLQANWFKRRNIYQILTQLGKFTKVSKFRIQSIAGSPLVLDVAESDYSGSGKLSVYKGSLSFSWTEGVYNWWQLESSTDKNSLLNVERLTLQFRAQANDSHMLYCYDATNSDDAAALVCADLQGTLVDSIMGSNAISLRAKSNNPLTSESTWQYNVRDTQLTIL